MKQERVYSIPEAIQFLREQYGADKMPTSEETLRRAIRSKQLRVRETGDPGRKGYTIEEDELHRYAEERLNRIRRRKAAAVEAEALPRMESREAEPITFPELYEKRIQGTLSEDTFYLSLYREKMKWETLAAKKREELKRLEVRQEALKGEITKCESSVQDYLDGIAKYGR